MIVMSYFKNELKKKVPEDIQFTPEFKILLSIIKKENISSADALKAHVLAKIRNCRDWIKENQPQSIGGTMRRHLKKYTDVLDFYELINKKVLRYL